MNFKRVVSTDTDFNPSLIRLMIGVGFLSEGTQKFLFADNLDSGRFAKISLPNPDIHGLFVGSFWTGCGFLVLAPIGLCYPEEHFFRSKVAEGGQ